MDGTLKDFIRKQLLESAQERVPADDEDLLSAGLLDSLSLMRLIVALRKSFGVKFEPGDLRLENFRTINVIAKRAERSRSS